MKRCYAKFVAEYNARCEILVKVRLELRVVEWPEDNSGLHSSQLGLQWTCRAPRSSFPRCPCPCPCPCPCLSSLILQRLSLCPDCSSHSSVRRHLSTSEAEVGGRGGAWHNLPLSRLVQVEKVLDLSYHRFLFIEFFHHVPFYHRVLKIGFLVKSPHIIDFLSSSS